MIGDVKFIGFIALRDPMCGGDDEEYDWLVAACLKNQELSTEHRVRSILIRD